MTLKLRYGCAVAVALLGLAAAAPASAQSGVRVGMLNCVGPGSTSYIIGSVTAMHCVFEPSATRRPERYVATVRRFGVDLGATGQNALAWAVFAPTQQLARGSLAGAYGGVTGGAVVGIGASANVLIGGSNNTFALQPVSVQSATGLNVAAGIAGLELRAVYDRRHRR